MQKIVRRQKGIYPDVLSIETSSSDLGSNVNSKHTICLMTIKMPKHRMCLLSLRY